MNRGLVFVSIQSLRPRDLARIRAGPLFDGLDSVPSQIQKNALDSTHFVVEEDESISTKGIIGGGL